MKFLLFFLLLRNLRGQIYISKGSNDVQTNYFTHNAYTTFQIDQPRNSSGWNSGTNQRNNENLNINLDQFDQMSGDKKDNNKKNRPNVIFMLGDDHGKGDTPWENDFLRNRLPNLMKLKQSGTLIENHYTAVVCSPSRGMLMTGRNSEKTGFVYLAHYCFDKFLSDTEKFMPKYFKELGYETLHSGKWHLGYAKWSQTPTGRGFDKSTHALGGHFK